MSPASGGVPPLVSEPVGTLSTMTRSLSLTSKLAEVMLAVTRIKKRGRNTHFNYDYATEQDIVEAVRKELASRQVICLPSVLDVRRDGKLTTITMMFSFIDGESGEREDRTWAGTGEDSADKGIWKAITGAEKYFLMKAFLMPTGDDPEATDGSGNKTSKPAPKPREFVDDPTDERCITPQQVSRLKSLLRTHNTNVEAFKAWVKEAYGYQESGQIQRRHYTAITKRIEEPTA